MIVREIKGLEYPEKPCKDDQFLHQVASERESKMYIWHFSFNAGHIKRVVERKLKGNVEIFCILTSVLLFQVGVWPREQACESYFHRRPPGVQLVFLPSSFAPAIPQLDGRIPVCKCAREGAAQRFVHNRCAQSTRIDNLRTSLSIG